MSCNKDCLNCVLPQCIHDKRTRGAGTNGGNKKGADSHRYYEKHKEEINAKSHERYVKNRESILEYQREYRKKNKNYIKK